MSWETFLKSHWGVIAATDLSGVEVLTSVGLIDYSVLFVTDVKTRKVKIAGIIPQLDGRWTRPVAHNLTAVWCQKSAHLISLKRNVLERSRSLVVDPSSPRMA